jgi:WD40 repeat protein
VATDGTLVLILTRDNQVRIFDPLKKETLRVIEGFPQPVMAMASSGLKRVVLLASKSIVFSLAAKGTEPPKKLWETRETIYSLTSAAVRDFAAVATSDGAFILNTRTGDLALSNRESTCLAAEFAPNERTLALAMGKQVVIYDVPTFVQKQVWPTKGFIYSLAYAPNSEFIAVGESDGR